MMAAAGATCSASSLSFSRSVSSRQCLTPSVARHSAPRAACMQPLQARVGIRFARYGRKKLPFYRLVAIDTRKSRDSKPIEFLGWYDPLRKETNLNAPSIKKWLAVGAKPSETVSRLLKKAMVID